MKNETQPTDISNTFTTGFRTEKCVYRKRKLINCFHCFYAHFLIYFNRDLEGKYALFLHHPLSKCRFSFSSERRSIFKQYANTLIYVSLFLLVFVTSESVRQYTALYIVIELLLWLNISLSVFLVCFVTNLISSISIVLAS